MKTISFSNASTPSSWPVQVQALTPWLVRFKNSFSRSPGLSTTNRVDTRQQPLAPANTKASNDSAFALLPEGKGPGAALPCGAAAKGLPRSSLRIVRESDPAISADCAGRMVISGRMADVCAELDRMALHATFAAK